MPTISMFYGIIIRMYCSPNEHNPPHIHVYYNEYTAILDLNSCEVSDGRLEFSSKRWIAIFYRAIEIRRNNVFSN